MNNLTSINRLNRHKNYGLPIRGELVRKLRQGWIRTRQDAAKVLGIAPSTAGDYVTQLITAGILIETRTSRGQVGRPIQQINLNAKAGSFVGIDFEATTLMVQVVDFASQPIYHKRVQLPKPVTAKRMLSEIKALLGSTISDFSTSVCGIGVGVPGLVDPEKGVGLSYPLIKGWKNISICDELECAFQLPVTINNTGRSGALAEQIFGQARQVSDFINLVVRSGIGAGIVERGHLVTGAVNAAGEVGQIPLFDQVQKANRPLESFASFDVICKKADVGFVEDRWGAFEARLNRKDKSAIEALGNAEQGIGQLIGILAATLNPQRIIIQSPLVNLGDNLRLRLIRRMSDYLKTGLSEQPDIFLSELGFYAGALGAAALAVDAWEPCI